MNSQKRTFDKLKQPPLDEMIDKLNALLKPAPVYVINGIHHIRSDYYPDIQLYLERIQLLDDNGWDYRDFLLALEKRSILEQIKEFNDNTQFPTELVDRAKKFFPNAKFIQASIELE